MSKIKTHSLFIKLSGQLQNILNYRIPFRILGQKNDAGSVYVQSGLISEEQKNIAQQEQKKLFKAHGKDIPFEQILLSLGFVTLSDIQQSKTEQNQHQYPFFNLFQNIKKLKARFSGFFIEEVPKTKIPIWLQLSLATMFLLALSNIILSYLIIERQRANLYENTVKLGMTSLNYFGSNAKIPLLSEDILELNTLINNAANVEGHLYAFIIDNNGIIKAHTDHNKIDKPFTPFKNVESVSKQGDTTYFTYTLPDDTHVLSLSMPILFNEKKLGEVHVGLSINFIRELFFTEKKFFTYSTLIIIFLGMIVAIFFSRRFSRPISTLVEATSQIAKGKYEHRVHLPRNDELGTLGIAFNNMGRELTRQSLMRENFGKYVGQEVLDMIMENPERGWLKGRKNQATVLFADIRGFTAYSENKAPEIIVEKLNDFFEITTKIVVKHGGYVDKFIGDSVLAVFGIPILDEKHMEKCVTAALEMQRAFLESALQNGANDTLLKSIGIGIASGTVLAGNIGSQAKMEYTVIGDCVNIASYLNGLAGAGEIILSGNVAERCKHLGPLFVLPDQKVKGREELVSAFRIS